MEERLIRASNPCCIPRSNRSTATFGEGYENSMSIEYGNIENEFVVTHDLNVDLHFADGEPWDEDKGRHAENKPEVLLTNDMTTAEIPFVGVCVVDIPKNDK